MTFIKRYTIFLKHVTCDHSITCLDKQKFPALNCKCFLTHKLKHIFLGTQKNRLIETVLLSTHNIRFG